ncbi:MAG TPA: hypothetical protein PKA95_09140, partial [Thermomicrobiales bacterium]|nr:hypothetical protein [Thermomicrobiales bacterium]
GAWTTIAGKKLQLFGSRKHLVRTFGAVKGKIGEITEIGAESMRVTAQGGQVEIAKVKPEEGKKVPAAEWARAAGVAVGSAPDPPQAAKVPARIAAIASAPIRAGRTQRMNPLQSVVSAVVMTLTPV